MEASILWFLPGFVAGSAAVAAIARVLGAADDRRRGLAMRRDELTGLPNRKAFVEALSAAAASPAGAAVLHLNLDGFETINDNLGYEVAGELLRHVAARLPEAAGEGTTVARLGGDEFAILSVAEPRAALEERARCVLDAVRAPQELAGRPIVVTASAGLARQPEDGIDAETLLFAARSAMRRAKRDGRGAIQNVTARMRVRSSESLELSQDLRGALARGEIETWFQPVVETKSRRVRGFEALLRWRHPSRGVLLPEAFLPIADEAGMMLTLGDFSLESACASLRKFRDAGGTTLTVAVNLSASQLRSPDALGQIERALATHALPPAALTLEITESVATSAIPHLPDLLGALAARGVKISLDDFGTGYASLADLTRLPIHELKLDRSFVVAASASPKAAAVARAVLALGRSLHLDVVAEGVESDEQAELISRLDCPHVQGFRTGAPLREDEILAALAERARSSPAA